MFRHKDPMCRKNRDRLPNRSWNEGKEKLSCGKQIRVTRFSDGSYIKHYGGPVGDVHFDRDGNET